MTDLNNWKEFPLENIDWYEAWRICEEFEKQGTTREQVIINKLIEDKEKLARVVYDLYQRVTELEKAVEKHETDYDHDNLRIYYD